MTADDKPAPSEELRLPRHSRSLPMMLLRAREVAMTRFRPVLTESGVTEQQWRTLRALLDLGELTAAGIAAECSILAPSMTRILRKLAEEGYITTTRSQLDQRELKVTIAPKGRQLVLQIAPRMEEQYRLLRDQLQPERLEALYEALQHLIDAAGGAVRSGPAAAPPDPSSDTDA
jgi:homoprotocatechuate degradation regulator HpaR